MEFISNLINQVIDNFNFAYVLSINILAYIIIKCIDEFNGDKSVSTKVKQIVVVISTTICCIIYSAFTELQTDILINSTILAPVAWDWLIKPIFKKFNISYKE